MEGNNSGRYCHIREAAGEILSGAGSTPVRSTIASLDARLCWKDYEWGVSNIPCAWDAIAVDICRRYRVRWTSGDYTLFINGESKARYPTSVQAKSAAQYDYEKRVKK